MTSSHGKPRHPAGPGVRTRRTPSDREVDLLPAVGDATYDRVTLAPGVRLDRWRVDDLGNSSYLLDIADAPTAALIDPWRDVDAYLPAIDRCAAENLLVLETHVHNDFVSGAREVVAERTATLAVAAEAPVQYPHRSLVDGEEIPIGRHRLQVWTTPGHTPEHVTYLLVGPDDTPIALFSGGALMARSAGRTDLLGVQWARPLAVKLYHTLHERIGRLPDHTQVFPTHGGGSFCGRATGGGNSTTIGEERATNRLLRATSLDAFLAEILDQRPYPAYFSRMREVNLGGAALRGIAPFAPPSLGLDEFDAAREKGAQVVDLRRFVSFDAGHVDGAYAIDFECGAFSAWVGWLLSPDRPLLFVDEADELASASAARQLFRIGFDQVLGTLGGGFETWSASGRRVVSVPRLDSRSLVQKLRSDSPMLVVDVRERHEFAAGHVPGAISLPLGELALRASELPREVPLATYCAHGYRSATAISVLERQGFSELLHADEGYHGWLEAARAG